MTDHASYTIHTDGGSRGNPGPAAAGYVIEGPGIAPIHRGERIGTATNNVAEYSAVVFALRTLADTIGADAATRATVHVYADSELLVKQMNGEYRVKNAELRELFALAFQRRSAFARVTFTHIRREKNREADRMVNEALDAPEKAV
jgi:ribonuclease HI